MAVVDWGRVTSITQSYVLPSVVHQLKKEMPTFGVFMNKAKKRTVGGTRIEVPVTYRYNTQGGSYSGLDVLNTAQEDTRTRAFYNWKQVYQSIVIDNMELFKNGASRGGVETVVDLLKQETEEAKESLKNRLSTMIFGDGTGNGGKDMLGMRALIDDGSEVVSLGDITFASYSWWQSNVLSAVGSLTLSHMATQYINASSGNDKVDYIFTTELLRNAYEALHMPSVRYVFQGNTAPKIDTIGGDALMFRGAQVMQDEYCPSGDMFFVNSDYIDLMVGDHPTHPTDKNGFTVTPMREPTDQDGQIGFILYYAQLIQKRPSRHSKSMGVTA